MQHTLDDVVAEVVAVPEGWTATDVSRRAGINRSTLHRISNGAVEPTLTTLRELAIVHGLDMTVQLTPLSDPDATTAARLLLATGDTVESIAADPTGQLPARDVAPGVRAWTDRLERVTSTGKTPVDLTTTQAVRQILLTAGHAADPRHRPGAVHLRGRRDALRLASAGEASPGCWAVSGGAAPDPVDAPGVLWATDVTATAALLADTHRTVTDPAAADVIVVPAAEDLFAGAVTVDGVCVVAPVQQLLDACGLGPGPQQAALALVDRAGGVDGAVEVTRTAVRIPDAVRTARGRVRRVGVADALRHFRRGIPRLVWNMVALGGGAMTLAEVHTLLGGVTVGGHLLDEEQRVLALSARCTGLVREVEDAGGARDVPRDAVDRALSGYVRAVTGDRRDLVAAQLGLAADLLPAGYRVPLVPRSRKVELDHALAALDAGDATELSAFLRDCAVL